MGIEHRDCRVIDLRLRQIPVSLGVVIVLLTIYYRFLSKKRPQPSIEKQPRSNDDDEEDIPEDDDLVAKFEAAKAFFANHSDEVDTEANWNIIVHVVRTGCSGRCNSRCMGSSSVQKMEGDSRVDDLCEEYR